MPRIHVENLTKVYFSQLAELFNSDDKYISYEQLKKSLGRHDKLAVDQVSFDLNPGDRLGIIGENGAGKSSLLSILAGIAKQTFGRYQVEGKITAVMTLGSGLREDLSGRENIYIDGEIQGKTREEIDKIIDQVIEFSELGKFIEYPVRTYSTGMKSRLGFSMLMNIDPEILIIDEALSAGDAFFATKATQAIKEICKKGKIVIIVSHSMHSITEMCNRCFWMEKGRIIQDGDPAVVTKAYLESVHQRDDHILEEKFRSKMLNKSFVNGNEISVLETTRIGKLENSGTFYTEEDLSINFRGKCDLQARPQLRFRLERLDALLVSQEMYVLHEASFQMSLELKPLILAQGIYQVTLEILDEKEHCLAVRSKIIEVIMLDAPAGGRPTLNYPCEITLLDRN